MANDRTCACPSDDAYACIRIRYDRDRLDEYDDDECACGCHDTCPGCGLDVWTCDRDCGPEGDDA